MEKKINKLSETYKSLTFEKKEYNIFDEEKPTYYYEVTGFDGNKDLVLTVDDEEDYIIINEILKKSFSFTPVHFGVEYDGKIEIALTSVNTRTSHIAKFRLKDKPAEIVMPYFKNQLDISIQFQPDESQMTQIMELMRVKRSSVILTISGYSTPTSEEKENDLRNIVNSVLFDFSYSYNLAFEPTNFDTLLRRNPFRRRNKTSTPTDKIQFIYKKYIPELVEYFNIGEKVDYPPFSGKASEIDHPAPV